MVKRRLGTRLVAGASVTALWMAAFTGSAAPAQADLIGDLLGTVGGVVNTTTTLLSNTVNGLLAPTGWIVEDGVTELDHVAAVVGADKMRGRGYDGRGVGVALVDTGVVPVKGLTSGNIVNGPDLSFESQSEDYRYLDTFGHGTHMAGIIAGNDPATLLGERFQGIAPGARLTSLKVGTTDGAVDVSQVIAAIDWVVAHRNDDPTQPDPGPEPVLRHGRRPGLPAGPADPRGRERLARRHRGRGRRRQQRHGQSPPEQPRLRPLRALGRRRGHEEHGQCRRRPRSRVQQPW